MEGGCGVAEKVRSIVITRALADSLLQLLEACDPGCNDYRQLYLAIYGKEPA